MSEAIKRLLNDGPKGVNVGLKSFAETLASNGAATVQVDWRPPARGNARLADILEKLGAPEMAARIDAANQRVVQKMIDAQPVLVDVVPAHTKAPILKGKVLLHAGPPILWNEMTGPMQASCAGAAVFEGWANTLEEAFAMLAAGEIEFVPCHHVGAVGPMGGITSGNMPWVVVKNVTDGNEAYCTLNEGIGKVLRMGANGPEVIERLRWMRDELMPALSKALHTLDGGLNLRNIMGRAITMGDEFHQRNIAASAIFLREISPALAATGASPAVFKFLGDTDQFFLNPAMAAGKVTCDAARTIKEGTILTTMTRNGVRFGIRVAACGDDWFTGPVGTPQGMYFSGYSAADANPDIGDSAITETCGWGGMAMAASPGVIRFVGAGGFADAVKITREMGEISIANNPHLQIPTMDFIGAPIGVDIRRVVETGILPIINTGIAHKEPGRGQIGAGTVKPPIEAFEAALLAVAEQLGL
jgi:hypothetical protein